MQSCYRLKSRKSYTYIYNHGRPTHKGALTLVCLSSKYGARFGFSAGKKVGGAVVRNRVRRRLKEAVRALIPEIVGGNSYIVVAKPETADMDFKTLSGEVRAVFKKAGLLKTGESAG